MRLICMWSLPRQLIEQPTSPLMSPQHTFLTYPVAKTTASQWHLTASTVLALPAPQHPSRHVSQTAQMWKVLARNGMNRLQQLMSLRAVPTCENLYHAGLSLCHCDGVMGGQQWVRLLHSHHADREWHLKYVHVRLQPVQRPWPNMWPQLLSDSHSI